MPHHEIRLTAAQAALLAVCVEQTLLETRRMHWRLPRDVRRENLRVTDELRQLLEFLPRVG